MANLRKYVLAQIEELNKLPTTADHVSKEHNNILTYISNAIGTTRKSLELYKIVYIFGLKKFMLLSDFLIIDTNYKDYNLVESVQQGSITISAQSINTENKSVQGVKFCIIAVLKEESKVVIKVDETQALAAAKAKINDLEKECIRLKSKINNTVDSLTYENDYIEES